MAPFVYNALPIRVVFGHGRIDALADEADRLGLQRALVICTPRKRAMAEDLVERLAGRAVGICDQARMHVPIAAAQAARTQARELRADGCVSVGGGTAVGLAKAVALTEELPIIAVPTTFSGSEMTSLQGLTEAGIKTVHRDPRMLPKTVIYDPALTADLPSAVAGPSGMNAMAHCVEALYARDANPITSLMAEEGIRALAESLPGVVGDPADIEARGRALYGAWLAGIAVGTVGMALHHKLCHTLGGSFDLPHAEVHTIILPHAAAYNREAAAEAMARVAGALGSDDAAGGLYDLELSIGAKLALKDIGMRESDLDRAAEIATRNPYFNPRPVTSAGVRALLDDAFHGRRPGPS